MRQHTIGMVLAVLLGLLLAASVPQAQATSLEKFPTSTSVIVAGWYEPTYAYALDGFSTVTETASAEQEYSGFGFALNSTSTIDFAVVWIRLTSAMIVDQANPEGIIHWKIKVYNGSAYTTIEVLFHQQTLVDAGATTAGSDTGALPPDAGMMAIDVTSILNTATKVNAVKVRILNVFEIAPFYLYGEVDAVSVEVAYSTEEAANMLPVGFLLGALIILPIGILIAKKR